MNRIESHRIKSLLLWSGLALVLAATPLGAETLMELRILSFGGAPVPGSQDPPDCVFTRASPCTFVFAGLEAAGKPVGKGTGVSTFTVLFHEGRANAHGFECFPTGLSSILTAQDGSELFIEDEGSLCEIGDLFPFGLSVFHGAYVITGGTGRFEGVRGGGNLSFGADGAITVGTIIFP